MKFINDFWITLFHFYLAGIDCEDGNENIDSSFQAGNKPFESVGKNILDQLGCGVAIGGVDLDDVSSGIINHN